jgi:hypothetical protein
MPAALFAYRRNRLVCQSDKVLTRELERSNFAGQLVDGKAAQYLGNRALETGRFRTPVPRARHQDGSAEHSRDHDAIPRPS